MATHDAAIRLTNSGAARVGVALAIGGSSRVEVEDLRFSMRADHAVLGVVYWDARWAPDQTGAQSGYDPGDLSDVVCLGEV